MLEAAARQLIDQQLVLAGWNVSDRHQVRREYPIHRPGQSDWSADYALLAHGRVVALVEAKKSELDPGAGREQALQYAQAIAAQQDGPMPLVLCTNGHQLEQWEVGMYPPQRVAGFPTPDDVAWMQERSQIRRPLSAELIDTKIVERSYQLEAIRSVLHGLEGHKRKFLLVQATGTGKTRVAVALMDVLRRAKWVKRVLFLVDRIALRDQALDAFAEHIPAEARWPQGEETQFVADRRIYVATYPAMLNLIEASQQPGHYLSPQFFDLVVADESHRSIYHVYKQVLDYFHGIRVGLTATPTNLLDRDTFALFACAPGDPTFAYSYQEAVDHDPPYLCSFHVTQLRTRFQLQGINAETLDPVGRARLELEGIDPDALDIAGTELERAVTNAGTNRLIVLEFMKESIKDPSGTLPGKTIVFAMSKAHARRLEEQFSELFPEHAGKLARVLVSEDPRVHGKGGLLDQFRTMDMPRVAISVDMLDTGIDVPEIVNLVFAKPVYSFTKFWQMIGRGTRVLPAPQLRRPWCTDKERFLILDCWGSFERFQVQPAGRLPAAAVALPVKLFLCRLDTLEAALARSATEAYERVVACLLADLAALPSHNVVIREAQGVLQPVLQADFWTHLSAEGLAVLRTQVAPLLWVRTGLDDKHLRFAILTQQAMTLLVANHPDTLQFDHQDFEALATEVMQQVQELPMTLALVAAQQHWINRALDPVWWAQVSDKDVLEMTNALAPLMKFRQPRQLAAVFQLDVPDAVALRGEVVFGPKHERLSTQQYRDRVEAAVLALVAANPVLQRLAAGQDVADTDLRTLADLLASQDPYITEDLLRKVYDHKTARFVQFMRHIMGLERLQSWSATVHQAFEAFLA